MVKKDNQEKWADGYDVYLGTILLFTVIIKKL